MQVDCEGAEYDIFRHLDASFLDTVQAITLGLGGTDNHWLYYFTIHPNMKSVAVFDKMVATQAHIQRKGKTVPYTSANGYMFAFVNKAGEIGIRLPKEVGAQFMEKYQTPPFMSHGAKMKEYVLIPESLYDEIETLSTLLQQGHEYVMSLKPK